jgi:N-acyl-D-amino-acid deacylase
VGNGQPAWEGRREQSPSTLLRAVSLSNGELGERGAGSCFRIRVFGMSDTSWDIVFENATLVDGTGAPRRKADVALAGARIADVREQLPEPAKAHAKQRLDLKGLVLAPGFIDVHAHGELEPLVDTRATGKVLSGVTTEISGNCGISPFPLSGVLREEYEHAAKDVDLGRERLTWRGADEYFAALESTGSAIHRAFLVGHGSARAAVNGHAQRLDESGWRRLQDAVDAALEAGCVGMSSGLIYSPGCFADADELIALSRICARKGALYTTHMRSEGNELEDSIRETLRIGRESGARTQISHLKTTYPQNWSKIEWVETTLHAARAQGLDVAADRYPYTASATRLDAILPSWVYEGGVESELARLADTATARRIEEEIAKRQPHPSYWSRLMVASAEDTELNAEVAGRSLQALADAWKVSPCEALRRILIRDRCRSSGIFHSMSEENLERILRWDFVMIGSDAAARDVSGPTREARPHPRTFGTFPRVLGHYVRERKLLGLEEAIRRMTSLSADTFHLRDRGRIVPGAWADLVVFDPLTVNDRATFEQPNRFPEGIERVFVNGKLVSENGRVLEDRPGRVLRRGV